MNSEDSPSNPMVILELTWPGEEQTEVPLFAAVNLTETLLKKLQMHSFLCRHYGLDDVVARFPDDEVFWDVRQDSALAELADFQTVWHSTSFDHEVRLRGRRPQPGGDLLGFFDPLEFIKTAHRTKRGAHEEESIQ